MVPLIKGPCWLLPSPGNISRAFRKNFLPALLAATDCSTPGETNRGRDGLTRMHKSSPSIASELARIRRNNSRVRGSVSGASQTEHSLLFLTSSRLLFALSSVIIPVLIMPVIIYFRESELIFFSFLESGTRGGGREGGGGSKKRQHARVNHPRWMGENSIKISLSSPSLRLIGLDVMNLEFCQKQIIE